MSCLIELSALVLSPTLAGNLLKFATGMSGRSPIRNYRIVYRVLPGQEEIHILRFWHAARGTPRF